VDRFVSGGYDTGLLGEGVSAFLEKRALRWRDR
jgi:hypothetical protein